MLEKAKVLKNAEKFFKTGKDQGFLTDKLINFLGESIISAPATTNKNMYGAFEGGLILQILLITKYAISLNDLLPETVKVDKSSLIKVCFIHQIGKTFIYELSNSPDSRGNVYHYVKNIVPLTIGERSIFFALSNDVELTEHEVHSILFCFRDDVDDQSKWFSSTLTKLLKQANELAILELKTYNKS